MVKTQAQRLEKYKISYERFNTAHTNLLAAGFTSEQAETLIIRQSSTYTVAAVINNYKVLLQQPYALTHQQIIKIAGHDGGSKNIEAVQAAYQPLKNLGFNADQVVKIAGHDGGSKNIQAVKNHYQALIDKGYNKEELVSMVARNSGSKRIYGIIEQSLSEDDLGNLLFFLSNLSPNPAADEPHQQAPASIENPPRTITSTSSSTGGLFSTTNNNKRKHNSDDDATEEGTNNQENNQPGIKR